jgi:C-terminal processing protease CtpA/Prc
VLPEQRALYVQYNEVTGVSNGETLAAFAAELVRTFEEQRLERVIVDVRSNGGGNNTTFGPLIRALQTPSIDREGVLYALVGRATFSAAGNFVTALQRDTKALLVGEPTGGAPNQYGDAESVPLPHHGGLEIRISTRYHEFGGPDDRRLTHEPDLPVPLSSADYFAGRDPVLEAALAHTVGR